MKRKPKELDDDVYERLKAWCERGDESCENERYQEAIGFYQQALALIPPPVEDWEAATWVLTALGDCHYLLGDFQDAHRHLTQAMFCPDAIGNPFIHLRLGETQLELGNEERAKDELARAYMGGGKEIFENEDPKYFAFIKRFMKGI